MPTSLRNSIIATATALVLLASAACDDSTSLGKDRTAADVLAQDTTLDLNIVLGNEDSLSEAQLRDVTAAAQPGSAPAEAMVSGGASTTAAGSSSQSGSASGSRAAQPGRVSRSRRAVQPASRSATRRARTSPRAGRAERLARARVATRKAARRAQRQTAGAVAVSTRPRPRPADTNRGASTGAGQASARGSGSSSGQTVAAGSQRVSRPAHSVVSAGSELALEAGQRVCTNSNSVGDRFEARLAEPLTAGNGTVIPRGATAVGEVSSLSARGAGADGSAIGLRINSLIFGGRTYALNSKVTYTQVDRVRSASRSGSVGKVAAGAGIGAVLGQVLGRSTKSTVIGAAGGAAAGAVLASRSTASFERCVPDGGRITARLTEPLTIGVSE